MSKSRRSTKKPSLKEDFAKWAEILDIEPPFIQTQFDVLLKEKATIFPDLPEKVLIPTVKRNLRTILKRDYGSLVSKAPVVRGFFVGSSELVNFIERMEQKAIRESEKDQAAFDKAVGDGLINGDGVPLDTREKMFGRDPNKYFGQPLHDLPVEHITNAHRRTLYTIGRQKGVNYPQFFSVDFHGKEAIDLEYETFQPITYRANIINEALIIQQRATPAATKIRSIEHEYDYLKEIEEACQVTSLSEFDAWHGANEGDWDRVICGKAIAAVISDQAHPETNSTMIITDDDSLGLEDRGQRLYVPDFIPITFGEETEFYFWGRTGNQKLRSSEEIITVVNVFGMYPANELATPEGHRSGRKVEIVWDDPVE